MIYMKTVDFLDADYISLFQVNCFVYIAYWSQNGTFCSIGNLKIIINKCAKNIQFAAKNGFK